MAAAVALARAASLMTTAVANADTASLKSVVGSPLPKNGSIVLDTIAMATITRKTLATM